MYFITPLSSYVSDSLTTQYCRDYDKDKNGLECINNRFKPQIAYSVACDISPFDVYVESKLIFEYNSRGNRILVDKVNGHVYDVPYNFGSAFTVAGKFGGPAILCNTRSGSVGGSAGLEAKFGEFILKQPKIGIAEALSKQLYPETHLKHTHHLIGEPEFEMWLDLPKKFNNLSISLESVGLKISDNDLLGSKITFYSGYGEPTSRNCTSGRMVFKGSYIPNDFALSVWKKGYLPVIRLYSFQGTVSHQTKYYLVQDAFLGNPLCSDSSQSGLTTLLEEGTKYTVNAINSITAYPGFIIGDGANVVLECDKTITLSCKIKAGGKLTVKAKDVKMTSNFTVEKGGVIEINKK